MEGKDKINSGTEWDPTEEGPNRGGLRPGEVWE